MIDGPIPEGLTFDDVLLLPGKSTVLPTEVDTAHEIHAQDVAQHPDRFRRHGYRDGIAPGHRHRAAGRNRLRPSQHAHRPAGAKKSTA